jgi:EAL domain-containing protein (putative c-di-GMP-specific phosphodiesterase class I)
MALDAALIRFTRCTQDGPTPDAIKVGNSFLDAIKKNASTNYFIRHIFVLAQE